MDTGRIEFGPNTTSTGWLRPSQMYYYPAPPAVVLPEPSADFNRLVFLLNEIAARIDALGERLDAIEASRYKGLGQALADAARRAPVPAQSRGPFTKFTKPPIQSGDFE